jgi:class 3 adenylate cyclase
MDKGAQELFNSKYTNDEGMAFAWSTYEGMRKKSPETMSPAADKLVRVLINAVDDWAQTTDGRTGDFTNGFTTFMAAVAAAGAEPDQKMAAAAAMELIAPKIKYMAMLWAVADTLSAASKGKDQL